MNWKSIKQRHDWRKYLTADEAAFIEKSDKASDRAAKMVADTVAKYGRERQLIVNRAIQRAKYDALKK